MCAGKFSENSGFHLEDEDALIRPSTVITDRLGHQHVLLISPPDENIVQQLPAPRSGVHPRGFVPRRKAEEGVGQQETVFRACSQKEVDVVTGTETVGAHHSLPGSVVYPDVGVEVGNDDPFVRLRHRYRVALPLGGRSRRRCTLRVFQGYKVSDHENPADFFIDLLHIELPAEVQECLNGLDPSVEDMRKYHNPVPGKSCFLVFYFAQFVKRTYIAN
ncbi:unnamed protein product [Schistocephalus solidus]|uniref:Uncharacterized protein n=1 Tax=Schistocephalus solidus TaxID=70667 RepID=A0A183SH38_SCHSO|nr:unnamed protein product [Schistocephalus solidus]